MAKNLPQLSLINRCTGNHQINDRAIVLVMSNYPVNNQKKTGLIPVLYY